MSMTRRSMIGALGAAAVGAVPAVAAEKSPATLLGISCSPRAGKTTATAVQIALDAARVANPQLQTELIDLGGMTIGGWNGSELPQDDFQKILPKLKNPQLAGLIIASPVYFRTMSALCKAFLEQCGALRKPSLLLANKPVGTMAVGAYRNGGQELVLQELQAALLCHEMMVVGGRSPALQGATLLSTKDDISGDETGISSARKLGQRVAEATA